MSTLDSRFQINANSQQTTLPAIGDALPELSINRHRPTSTVDWKARKSTMSPAATFFASYSRLPRRSKLRLILCLVAFIMVVSLSIPIGYTARTPDFHPTTWMLPLDNNNTTIVLGLGADLVKVDVDTGVAVFDWYIHSDSRCRYDANGILDCPSADPNSIIDIFVDPNTLLLSDSADLAKNASDNVPAVPIFSHNATAVPDLLGSIPSFRTVLRVSTDRREKAASLSSLQNYPFDIYYAEIYMFGSDSRGVENVTLSLVFTSGVAVGYKTIGIPETDEQVGSYIYEVVRITRSGLVKTFVMVIIITVWLVTLMFTFLTVCIMCGYKFDISLLLIPIVTLFTITQMRGAMPGAPPGFGAIIDFAGTLPCLALTSISATIIVTLLVFRPNSDSDHELMGE